MFVGTLLVAPLTIRRSLRPLGRLSAQAALIEPDRTDVRLNEDGIPSEILPLVEKINEALARIDEGFEQQRRFTSNAAHELRTPLAILRARIDGLEESPAKEGLIRDVERMSRLDLPAADRRAAGDAAAGAGCAGRSRRSRARDGRATSASPGGPRP